VRKLLAGKGAPKWVAEPTAWLDGQAEGWKGYLDAVEWTFGAPDLQAVRREIREQIGSHPTLRLLPPEDILERLIGEVLHRSSQPKRADRVLTRTDLARLADSAGADLAEWAKTAGAPLRRLFEEIEKLDGLLTDHTRELRENPTPGQLLTASYEVIPFHEAGRERELALLADWCNSNERRDVLLLTGEGGAGKTRLAIEWCRRLRHQGWHAGFLQWECDPAGLPALLSGAAPRLVVIDYAETRLSVLKPLLYKMAVGRSTGPKMRLLLLSRREGDWWEALRRGDERAEVGDLLAHAQTRPITPLVAGQEERRSAFRAAAEGFALVQGAAAATTPAGTAVRGARVRAGSLPPHGRPCGPGREDDWLSGGGTGRDSHPRAAVLEGAGQGDGARHEPRSLVEEGAEPCGRGSDPAGSSGRGAGTGAARPGTRPSCRPHRSH